MSLFGKKPRRTRSYTAKINKLKKQLEKKKQKAEYEKLRKQLRGY